MEKHEVAIKKREKRQVFENQRKVLRARNEGLSRQYFLKQKKNGQTMLFRMYSGEQMEGSITGILPYYFYLGEGREQQKLEKLNIIYCYKKEHAPEVTALPKDPDVLGMGLQPVRDKTARTELPEDQMKTAMETHQEVQFVMHDGTVVRGTVDWYSKYNVKIRLGGEPSIVIFTHGVHSINFVKPVRK
ncbi:MAG: hypothetical protein ACYCW6_03825 [Candidatus Xenobia bacterium]